MKCCEKENRNIQCTIYMYHDLYENEYQEAQEAIDSMITKPYTRFPILLVRGKAHTGKHTFVERLMKQNQIRVNYHSSLEQKKMITQDITNHSASRANVLSMFTKNPKPIVYGFRHIERIMVYEKAVYRSIIQYLKSTTADKCKPMIFILTEPLNTQKYQDLLPFVSWTVDLEGPTKEWLYGLFQEYHVPHAIANTYAEYAKYSFQKMKRVLREIKSSHTTLLKELENTTFLESSEKNTMKQRLQLYFERIGTTMPNQIQKWSTMLQETELATMGQTIHETIFEHFDSFEEYETYLQTLLISNQFQLLQHLYNRHAIEPYWIQAMIHIPFMLAKPYPSTIKFTKLLTRSSIQSNYRKFVESMTRTKSLYTYMNEYETYEKPVQQWIEEGVSQGDARRLFRSFERMKQGGLKKGSM